MKPSAPLKNTDAECLLISGDVGQEDFCRKAVGQIVKELGKIDILVNNAAEQHPQKSIEKLTEKQLERTFRTNIFSFFFMTKAAMKYLSKGSAIINTTSVTAYKGSAHLLDYSSTKGAITAFTRSLSQALADKRYPSKWRRAGSDLDTVNPVYFFPRRRWRLLDQMFRLGGLVNQKKSRQVMCFLHPTILHT